MCLFATQYLVTAVFVLVLTMLMFFLVMSHLCASEFGMPCFWSRDYDDANGRDFMVKCNPKSDLHNCFVWGDKDSDKLSMFFEHHKIYLDIWRKGSTLVEVRQRCFCACHTSTGYVFNAPQNSTVGGLSIVTPTEQTVTPPRFSQAHSRRPKTFCDYFVGETSFSAKMRLCEYNDGGFFFVRVKCVYKDINNIFVSWGEETPCGTIKDGSFGDCKFSFNTCTYRNPHFCSTVEKKLNRVTHAKASMHEMKSAVDEGSDFEDYLKKNL